MFGKDEDEELMEQVDQMLNVTMQTIKRIPDELYTLQAKSARKAFFAFIEEGFNQEQALTLTAASLRAVK